MLLSIRLITVNSFQLWSRTKVFWWLRGAIRSLFELSSPSKHYIESAAALKLFPSTAERVGAADRLHLPCLSLWQRRLWDGTNICFGATAVMAGWHTRFVQRRKEWNYNYNMFPKTRNWKVIFAIKAIFHCSTFSRCTLAPTLHFPSAGFSPWQNGKTKPEEPCGNWFWSRASADLIKACGLAFSLKKTWWSLNLCLNVKAPWCAVANKHLLSNWMGTAGPVIQTYTHKDAWIIIVAPFCKKKEKEKEKKVCISLYWESALKLIMLVPFNWSEISRTYINNDN